MNVENVRAASFTGQGSVNNGPSPLARRSVGDSTCSKDSLLSSFKANADKRASMGSSMGDGLLHSIDSPLGMRHSTGYTGSCSASQYEGYIEMGCHSMEGTRYAGLQQDFMAIQQMYAKGEIPRDGKQIYIAIVTDGHGIIGELCAQTAGKALCRSLYLGGLRNKNLSKIAAEDISSEMKTAFIKGHKAALSVYDSPPQKITYLKKSGKKVLVEYSLTTANKEAAYKNAACIGMHPIHITPQRICVLPIHITYSCSKGTQQLLEGGCTATAAVVQGKHLSIANVGDSHAVLGIREGPGQYKGQLLTMRHHGKTPEEATRMESFASTTKMLDDGYLKINEGPWMGYELAVTRALGHKNMEQYGVIPDPTVIHMELDPEKHCCLIVASDGIWDCMTPDEAVEEVMKHSVNQGAAACAKELVHHCIEKQLQGEDEDTPGEADNTTAVVVLFD